MGLIHLLVGSFFTIGILMLISNLLFANTKNLGDLSYQQEESLVPEKLDYAHALFTASLLLSGFLILLPNIEKLKNLSSERGLIFGFYALSFLAYLILNKQLWNKKDE